MSEKETRFRSLGIAVLTVSDTRTLENDTSGSTLVVGLESAGHRLVGRDLLPDNIYRLRARVSAWIADPEVEVILTTGGTGLTGRDVTCEALRPLLDKEIVGFGELFRMLSYEEIGTSTIESRAFAGIANSTVIFCVPGSTGACRTAWERIIETQLDARHKPCNLVQLLPRLSEV